MIVLAISAAAMLVVASLTGRALARARELYSVPFAPADLSPAPTNRLGAALRGPALPRSGSSRWPSAERRVVELVPNEILAAQAACSNN
jgi:hypothetical protein